MHAFIFFFEDLEIQFYKMYKIFVVMMMVAPNSLARQKEGFRGGEEEDLVDL